MPVIGTAGHVDHGKSSLVLALTGRDPDRWEEEKRRGLTIDLGFAWATFGSGVEVSFVDVPGHERYLKNMLAGIEAIDIVMFVVAADEGWMPQSEEHLAVIDLLGVKTGVIALTKADLVEEETTQLVTLDIEERLAGTGLAGAEVVPVSALTGAGMDTLRSRLEGLVSTLPVPGGDRPRLWVDRSFSVAGAGTVVTGTLLEGWIETGDELEVLPHRTPVRVRGLQSHERDLERAGPGRRLAVNLTGVERDRLPRGVMLGRPGQWDTTTRFSAELRPARYADPPAERGAYQIHVGSGAHSVTLEQVSDEYAVLRLGGPLPLRHGDRFILRDTGRRLVVAGGRVLDPAPGRGRRAMAAAPGLAAAGSPGSVADLLLATRGSETVSKLEAHSGGGRPASGVEIGGLFFARDRLAKLSAEAERLVEEEHRAHPLRRGLPLATLANRLGVTQEIAQALVDGSGRLTRQGPDVAHADHVIRLSPDQEEAFQRARQELDRSLAVPDVDELGLGTELVHLLVRTGRLVRLTERLAFLPEQIEQIVTALRSMPDGFTVAQFRDATGLSRKYAVPVLEWADREGITRRVGDGRTVRS